MDKVWIVYGESVTSSIAAIHIKISVPIWQNCTPMAMKCSRGRKRQFYQTGKYHLSTFDLSDAPQLEYRIKQKRFCLG